VQAGYRVLAAGGSAIDAVEAAVVSLEDDPSVDAGTGSWLTDTGGVELDAMIMSGQGLQCGSVGAVCVRNPVRLAREVMEDGEHVLLVGDGAMKFGEARGIPRADPKDLVTPDALEELRKYRNYGGVVRGVFQDRGHDTVGAVALDRDGRLACATSTGGVSMKRSGRVGDSPIVGAGGYADGLVGCASATGHGESILKTGLCHRTIWKMEAGASPQLAAEEALAEMRRKCGDGGCGGLIVLSPEGDVGKACTTKRMVWAMARGSPGSGSTDAAATYYASGIEPGEFPAAVSRM